jgi:hypothetical protein
VTISSPTTNKTCKSVNIIEQTNAPVWRAIAAVRIERNPLTMGQLYDALRKRRNARAYTMPQWMRDAWDYELGSDLRAYGQQVRTLAELQEAVNRHAIN